MKTYTYYVYLMASASRTLYTGVTNNLERRVLQHRDKLQVGFTALYNINRLVYFEVFGDVRAAISREKQIKGWTRGEKIALIESVNRDWKDLSDGWYGRGAAGNAGAKQPERDPSRGFPEQAGRARFFASLRMTAKGSGMDNAKGFSRGR